MNLAEEIKRKENELNLLKKSYIENTPFCDNKNCAFYHKKAMLHCTWITLVEDCKNYFPAKKVVKNDK